MSQHPEPTRITAALDLRGLHGPEVDHACGVEEPAVDQWETGELVPTPGQVKRLALLTGFPVEFFYLPPIESLSGRIFICSRGRRGPRRAAHAAAKDTGRQLAPAADPSAWADSIRGRVGR